MAELVFYKKGAEKDSVKEIVSKVMPYFPVKKDERVAIKVHFGEKGNSRFVSPSLIKPIVDELSRANTNHFLTDCNTLYSGMRTNARDHLKIAAQHGFASVGCPIIIADGETGDDYESVKIKKMIFEEVMIGKEIARSDAMLAISHFKGHVLFGFGGALKNTGMGCGSRGGKLKMHSKVNPSVNEGRCTGCGICMKNCLYDAIEIKGGKAYITDRCTGCARCISACPSGAIRIPWGGATHTEVMSRTAEYAYGALLGKKRLFITFMTNITKDCDCLKDSRIICEDAGIAAGFDPVALDQACYDILLRRNERDVFFEANGVDGTRIMEHAENIGLGTRKYELVEL